MSIIYSSERQETGGNVAPYHTWKATKKFVEHFYNALVLNFIATKSTDRNERLQAQKELEIANRKMEFWRRHPNYDHKSATDQCRNLKSQFET